MSKSFEWVTTRAKNQGGSLAESDWSEAVELSNRTTIDTFISVSRALCFCSTPFSQYKLTHVTANYMVKIKHDENADFQYFASASCLNDGTLLFQQNLIHRVASKVVTLQTCYAPYANDLAKSGTHIVNWTIGNFVLLNEYGDQYAPQGKPWMKMRSTVLLPLRMDIQTKEGGNGDATYTR